MNTLLLLSLTGFMSAAPMHSLHVREALVDKGEAKAGVPLSHTFILNNRGQSPATITEVNGGCGCLKPLLSRKEIAAGESADLLVEVNTLSQGAGPIAWKISVRYAHGQKEQPIAEELELVLKAAIVREITVEPVALSLSIDKETTHTIALTDRRPKPLTIKGVRCEAKFIKTQLTATGPNSRGERIQQVHVTILENCPAGHHREMLQLLTDDPEYRELRVPIAVTWKAPGEVLASPEQLDLRIATGQHIASGLIRLRDPDGRPVLIDRIEADHTSIRFKWAAGPGSMATLRLGVELDAKPTSGLGSVKVFVKEPKAQVLVIPVSWQVP